ncbi:MAG: hypothetical protein AAGA43_04010 [Bacteroidota bacterium]
MKKSALLIWILLLFSCSKEEGNPTPENLPPTDFTVTTTIEGNLANLIWSASEDPEGGEITYTISINSEVIAEGVTTTSYQIANLDFESMYNGIVTAKDEEGLESSSNFQFSILEAPNSAPQTGSLNQPENNSIQRGPVTFQWEPAIDAENDTIVYDLYVNYNGLDGFSNNFFLLAENLSDRTFLFEDSPGIAATISWYVEAKDGKGLSTNSETFSYRTVEETALFDLAENPPFEARDNHGLVWFNNKLFLVGGGRSFGGSRYNDVWVSDRGINWTELDTGNKFTPRLWNATVVFDNKIWVIGGNTAYTVGNELNDIWSSEDGDTWVQETGNAAFAARYGHRVVVFDNQLWLIGGRNANNDLNRTEVWKSNNGKDWTLVTDNANFGTGSAFDVVVFQGKMWKIASSNNTVLSSTDGITWNIETDEAAFGNRRQHSVTVFDDKLWLFSGTDPNNGNPLFDLWYSTNGKEWILSNDDLGYGVNEARCVAYETDLPGDSSGIIIVGGNEGANGRGTTNAVKSIIPTKFQN